MSAIRKVGLCGVLLGGLFLGGTLTAQQPTETVPVLPGTANAPVGGGRLPAILATARQAIKEQQWDDAAHALHMLLASSDVLIPVSQKWAGDGKETTHWFSPYAAANALMGPLAPKGLLAAYQKHYGQQAAELLLRAQQKQQEIKAELERSLIVAKEDWPLFRGNAARNGFGAAGLAKVKANLWARPTVLDRLTEKDDPDPGAEAKVWLDRALKTVPKDRTLLASGAVPILVGDVVIYKTHFATTCVAIRDFKDGNEEVKSGELVWKSTPQEGSLGYSLSKEMNSRIRFQVESWLREHEKNGVSSVILENSLVGTLSATRKLVFLVDDLAVPPPAHLFQQNKWENEKIMPPAVKSLIVQNHLVAFEVVTGKMVWQQPTEPANKAIFNKAFLNSHWLGAPLPLGDFLYALNEQNDGTLRLVCLEVATGKMMWMQTLATVREKFLHNPNRRTQACHLAYQDGVLLCPTNAGTLLAFDLVTRTLLWAHTYRPLRETDLAKIKLVPAIWQASAPMLHNGQVIYAGPDDEAIHCLNLRDGQVRWRAKRENAHYVAGVFGERVLLVGQDHCRALRLKDGGELWKVAIDQPTGLGVLSADGLLTLPMQGKSGVLWTLNTAKGQVVDRQALQETEALGNLLRHGELLLSQSATRVSAHSLAK